MTETERDREIVSRMREYCRDIGETHAYFGASADAMASDARYAQYCGAPVRHGGSGIAVDHGDGGYSCFATLL